MDIIIVGGGPAGRTAAMEAAGFGENVVLVEKDKIGGTCLNEGCVVYSGLNDLARFFADAENFKKYGVGFKDLELSYENVVKGIKDTIKKIRHVLETETKNAGVKLVSGTASIEDGALYVKDKQYNYDKLIIATGSRPFIPQIEGSKHALTYKDILKFKEIPEKLVIIGSGVIAAESAGIFSTLGSEVEILGIGNFLGILDDDIRKYVAQKLLKNVRIHENIQINRINKKSVITSQGKFEGTIFLATGMIPNSEIVSGIVDLGKRGEIEVNNRMQTSDMDIYAAGDVIGGVGTTPVARMEGVVAARNCCGIFHESDYRFIPHSLSLYYDVAFLRSKDSEETSVRSSEEFAEGIMPGSAGPGSFWNVLENNTGLTRTSVNLETGDVDKIFSISPSARTSMAYMSKLLRDGYKTQDFDDFVETHPSTDVIYKLMRFFAKYE